MAVRTVERIRLLPGLLAGALVVSACGGETVQTIETDGGAQVLRVESAENDNFEAPTTTVREYQETTRGPGATRTRPTEPPSTLAAVDETTADDGTETTAAGGGGDGAGGGDGSTTEAPTSTAQPTTTAAPYPGEQALSLPFAGADGLTLQSVRIVCSNPMAIEVSVTSPNGVASSSQYVATTSFGTQFAASGIVPDSTSSAPGGLSPALTSGAQQYTEICSSSTWTVFVRISDDAGNTIKGVVQASVG